MIDGGNVFIYELVLILRQQILESQSLYYILPVADNLILETVGKGFVHCFSILSSGV